MVMGFPDNLINGADEGRRQPPAAASRDVGHTPIDDLIELAPVAVIVRDFDDDVITSWSRGAEDLYGWSRAESLGQVIHTFLQTQFPVSCEDVRETLRRTGQWEGELVHTRRDGALRVVASRQAVRWDETRRPVAIQEINTDITQRKHMEDDLRTSEERFRLLVEGVQDYAIYWLSPDGIVESWNDGAARLKGYRASEILGRSFTQFYTPEDIERGVPHALLARAVADGRVAAEGWRVRQDGSRFWADIVLTALRDERGQLRGFAKVTRDATARRQAEEDRARAQREEGARLAAEALQEDLRVSRDQFAAILAGVAEGITVQNSLGHVVYANDAAARLSGFSDAATFLGASSTEVLHRFTIFDEAGAPLALDRLPGRRILRGEEASEMVVQFRFVATGEVHWSLIHATPIRDQAGTVQFAVNIFYDITERRRTEVMSRFLASASVELTRSLDYEQTLTQVAHLAVPALADWCVVDVVDDNGQIQRVAAAHVDPAKVQLAQDASRLYPVDPHASVGVARVLRTGQSELAAEVTDEHLAAGARDADHVALLRSLQIRSGLTVPLIARDRVLGAITLVQAESGRRYGERDLAVAEDLAVRAALALDNARLYREARHQAETQVELNAALREAMDRLQDVLRTRDEFLAAASHDLKNPIASIKAMAQLLRRQLQRPHAGDPTQIVTGLTRIDVVASRANGMVEELLDVARLQMGQPLDLDRQPVDLVALSRQTVAEYQDRSARHRIRLEADTPEVVGCWDRNRLARVLSNLLDNAVKYSPNGGAVHVRIRRADDTADWIVVTVDDEGVGIPPDDLERVFERFHRGSNVVGLIPGTGIGLTSVRHIIEGHGGSIRASRRSDRGTTFTIRLPVASVEAAMVRSEHAPRGGAPA